MSTLARRVVTTGIATSGAVALAAGPASAHFCFKTALNGERLRGWPGPPTGFPSTIWPLNSPGSATRESKSWPTQVA